jgi:CRISPR/Cas system CSM-associated protein Csm2 small subunit
MATTQQGFEFPADYGEYLDDKGIIKCKYLTSLPEGIAEYLESERLTMSQLRAFYAHAKRAEDAWRRGLPLEEAVREIQKLESHASDRFGKRKITPTFYNFLRKNAKCVIGNDGGKTFKAFLEHFQALVGFCAGRLNERDRT